jgi:hypothetical protein
MIKNSFIYQSSVRYSFLCSAVTSLLPLVAHADTLHASRTVSHSFRRARDKSMVQSRRFSSPIPDKLDPIPWVTREMFGELKLKRGNATRDSSGTYKCDKLTVEVSPVWSKLKMIDLPKSSPVDAAPL